MSFEDSYYPDFFTISGKEFKGRRDIVKHWVDIPFTEEIKVDSGDTIMLTSGSKELHLKVIDLHQYQDGTGLMGTEHPHFLRLIVENVLGETHRAKHKINTFNFNAPVSGGQVQIGENNHLQVNVSITELIDRVAKSNDREAKSMLIELLNNSTVASIIGAGASTLLGMLL
ncbi:conserved hypothetical protein [Enterobacterales bacterium 8AC]|nr:conserved hypothetical protein [Enterobacterales bacterium 8AC]